MKKLSLIFALCIFAVASVFAQIAENAEKPVAENAEKSDIVALKLAYALADYGYENNSASALIEAADIIYKIDISKLEAEKTGSSGTVSEDVAKKYTAENLLKEGKKLAGKDKNLTKWAADVEKAMKKAASGTRGAAGGPVYDVDAAGPNGGYVRYTLTFVGSRLAECAVNSLNGCDYDLYVYDENSNLIASDCSYNTSAYVSFVPAWTGVFYVIVKNRSTVSGAFEFFTN